VSDEINKARVVSQIRAWLKAASPPPTRTMDMDGGLPVFRKGTIDADSPFADRLGTLIAKIDRSLESLGSPPASNGRWRDPQLWGSKQTEELRDLAATLGNASAWAQAALAETDINRKLHLAFQAGWEACAARAIDSLGEYARAGRASITDGREAGNDLRDPKHDEIMEEMQRHRAAGLTVNNAAKKAAEAGYGTSQKANKNRWDRVHARRSRKKPS